MLPTAPAIAATSAVFAAVDRGDWEVVAANTAPETIERTRRRELAHVLAWAEYMADYDRRGQGFGSGETIRPELLARFGDVKLEWMTGAPTIAQLAALEPAALFSRWLRYVHEHPLPRQAPRPATPRRIIGAVAEGDRFVHVVYRGVGWIPIERVQIMPVTRFDDRWVLLQNDDVIRMAHLPLPDDPRA
jgi:hypothetical protein